MSIISGIVTAVTTVAETVAASIAAAIAGPTLATVTTAVVTVGLVVGAGYLIYKGVKKLLDRAENYVDKRHEEENIPARFKFNTIRDDEDENEIELRIIESADDERIMQEPENTNNIYSNLSFISLFFSRNSFAYSSLTSNVGLTLS